MALRGMSSDTGASSGAGNATATKRIQRELKEICQSPSAQWSAGPVADDLFEWQFAVRGPPGTDFEGGIYTGRIALPMNYPLAPPSIMMLTPNGRWEVGKKICLSNTNYHPDLWQPAWGIRTIIEALRSHFPFPGDGAIGALDWPGELRRRLAKESLEFVCQTSGKPNRELLPELSAEEMREGSIDATAPLVPVVVPLGEDGQTSGDSMAATVAPSSPPPETSPEGLRQRHTASADRAQMATAPATAAAAEAPPANPGKISQTAAETNEAQPTGAGIRRRQRGVVQQRRQPVWVQLLKPPRSRRGWVLLAMDLIIVLLTLSFMMRLTEFLRNPPQILEKVPERKPSA